MRSESKYEGTYRIKRFYFDHNHPDHHMIVKDGLTLEEAQEHCQDESTHEKLPNGSVVWFDGYEKE